MNILRQLAAVTPRGELWLWLVFSALGVVVGTMLAKSNPAFWVLALLNGIVLYIYAMLLWEKSR